MESRETVEQSTAVLLRGLQALSVPIIHTEQYPKGLGNTILSLQALLNASDPPAPCYEKLAFSCLADPTIAQAIKESGAKQLIIAGIETHVCVLQTVLQALELSLEVMVASDAVSSRSFTDYHQALDRMTQEGARIGSVESILFELLESAENPAFREISRLIK
jgi:hypothetical protein